MTASPNTGVSALVGVATYKRPSQLRDLLESIAQQSVAEQISVVVVDNDPGASARAVCAQAPLQVQYFEEPTPGIAAARNRALSHLYQGSYDWILFVDDDEIASEKWAETLLERAQIDGSEVICGPVVPVYPETTPGWIIRGGFFARSRSVSGITRDHNPATNNTLVSRRLLDRAGQPFFDEEFSLTGGSDSEFFDRLRRLDPQISWSDEAVVTEVVEPSRASFAWLMRRKIRLGNVSARLMLRRSTRARVLARGLRATADSLPVALLDAARGRGLTDRSLSRFGWGVGHIGVAIARPIVEYRRAQK